MEFLLPSSPITLLVALLLVAFLVVRVTSDYRAVRQTRRLYKQLVEVGKAHSQKSMTVVIELSKKAETIFPLLDSLYAQGYPLLQVVVVIKRTAEATARTKLNHYKREHKVHLKVVTFSKKQTPAELLKRAATGDVVIKLNPDEKISSHFFEDLSLDFLDSNVDSVLLNKVRPLNKTISSALYEHFALVAHLRLGKAQQSYSILSEGVAFRRTAAMNNKSKSLMEPTRAARSAFISASAFHFTVRMFLKKSIKVTETLLKNRYGSVGSIIIFLALIAFLIVFPFETLLFIGTAAVLYTALYALVIFQHTAYQFMDKINLVLLSPFALIYGVLIYVITLFYHVCKSGNRLFILSFSKIRTLS